MVGTQTHGFDAVIELSSNRVASLLRLFFLTGNTVSFPVSDGINVKGTLSSSNPISVTIGQGNRLSVTLRFSQADFISVNSTGMGTTKKGFTNIILTVTAIVNTRRGIIQVTFPSDPVLSLIKTEVDNALPLIRLMLGQNTTVASFTSLVQTTIRLFMETSVTKLPVIPIGINFAGTDCPVSVAEVQIHTIPDSLFLLLALSSPAIPSRTPDATQFTTSLRGGSDSVILFSNEALLGIGTCFLANTTGSPMTGATFSGSGNCRALSQPIDILISGITIKVEFLTICVVGNEIVITGTLTTSIPGCTVTGSFFAPIGFMTNAGGLILPVFDPNRVITVVTVTFEWWVYVAIALLAPIWVTVLGPFVGLVVTVLTFLITPLASIIAQLIANGALAGVGPLLANAVTSGYALLPPSILNMIGALKVQQVILDDLALEGTLMSVPAPSVTISLLNQRTINAQDVAGVRLSSLENTYAATNFNFFDSNIVSYEWFINGATIAGSGTINSFHNNPIIYHAHGDHCGITNPLGESISLNLGVRITTGDGFSKCQFINIAMTGMGWLRTERSYGDLKFLHSNNIILANERESTNRSSLILSDLTHQESVVNVLAKGMKLDADDLIELFQ